ncbi:hypothetical protein [Clostridium sp.]|uniref:hypothetical protein n=1 Tax=Clostridium sp. TaxID=1506 RepID=UPI0026DB3F70|nr:hypothetical protein [Clostridium sp.]MDO5039013.1 hypothetical protein [Clostridium sp.]
MHLLKKVSIKVPMYILIILSLSLTFISCNSKSNIENSNLNLQPINLEKGSVLLESNGKYKVFDLQEDKYHGISNDRVIINFNKESGTYIFVKDGKHYIYYKGKEIPIKDSNYNFIKISYDGRYVSYMSYDNGYNLKVISLEDDKEINIKSKVAISGNLYDFIKNDKLVYYGISEDKINGIFTYDLKENKEELLYNLKSGGYVDFLKGDLNSVFVFQQKANNEKILLEINAENKNINNISNSFKSINDLEKQDNSYYILGEAFDDTKSLYKLKDKNIKKLVFSFPSSINMKKGIQISNSGILFIGSNSSEGKEEVFSYKDNSVSLISNKEGNYNFININ